MGLSKALEEKKYDHRLVRRNVDKGFASPEGYEKFIQTLEDDTSLVNPVVLEEETSEKN